MTTSDRTGYCTCGCGWRIRHPTIRFSYGKTLFTSRESVIWITPSRYGTCYSMSGDWDDAEVLLGCMIFKTSREIYGHIDCNCFFVSCERLRRPELQGKMVVVGGDIIVAASYECRKFGVSVGTPLWRAREILGPKLICIKPDLHYYTQISRAFLSFLEEKSLFVEPFSIDEAFV